MYLTSYILTVLGLLGMALYHPEPKAQVAIFFLLIANGIFFWR